MPSPTIDYLEVSYTTCAAIEEARKAAID